MQGLRVLCEYQGRTAQWARLVEEIRPDYCTAENEPILGSEGQYTFAMDYRVRVAKDHERDLVKAATLQEKCVEYARQRAAAALAMPVDAPLDGEERQRVRTLAVSVERLGHILREQGKADCMKHYQEAMRIYRRIQDKAAEAIAEFNLGHAYKNLPVIRNLDAAEAAYQRSLDLRAPNDALGRSKCIMQIGVVHHDRFRDARERKERAETLMRHAQAAQKHYLQGLRLCPRDALTGLAPKHNELGSLYAEVGQLENAREHYEQAAQCFEKTGDRFNAGVTRFNMAVMYAQASQRESQPSQQRAYVLRARAYAEAALRDYQSYEGRAAKDEADARGLIDQINQDLAKLPE